MKLKHQFILGFGLMCSLTGCEEPKPFYSNYKPILVRREEADKAIKYGPKEPQEDAGKFYLYRDYIFLAEENKGYHIINNSNPNNPAFVGFLHIQNSTDVSIKDDVLYANQSTDLLVINLKNFPNINLIKRMQDVSKEITPDQRVLNPKYTLDRPKNTIAIDWKIIDENATDETFLSE
jgi:hypothetical protein